MEIYGIELPIKTFTVRAVYDALAKNGFEHLRENWFDGWNNGKPVGACVLGQAALNLDIIADNEGDKRWGALYDKLWKQLSAKETPSDDEPEDEAEWQAWQKNWDNYNDAEEFLNEGYVEYSLVSQLDNFYNNNEKWNDTGYPSRSVGSLIIHWNDKYENEYKYDDDGRIVSSEQVYVLPTYEDVKKMAYEIMEPFFDKTVELLVVE